MAVSKQPTLTPDTSSGEGLDEDQASRGAKWKRFHPFKVVRKIFRRRVKRHGSEEVQETSKKSWSTSELQCVQDNRYDKPPYKVGLSVSHDSIFSPDHTASVNHESIGEAQGSSLSVQNAGIKVFKEELFTRVRARRDSNDEDDEDDDDENDDDDDDMGLPHSPCTSPTTVDVLAQGLKDKSKTTCSAGSLISMGSSENDEDSAAQLSSGHSSKKSLLDRHSLDSDLDVHQSVPLSHKAAHHRIAVRPKRTHGLPRHRCLKQLAASGASTLPSTPEVSEDNTKPVPHSSRATLVTESSTVTFKAVTSESSLEHGDQEINSNISSTDVVLSSSVTSTSRNDYFTHTVETNHVTTSSRRVLESASEESNASYVEMKSESSNVVQAEKVVKTFEQEVLNQPLYENQSVFADNEDQDSLRDMTFKSVGKEKHSYAVVKEEQKQTLIVENNEIIEVTDENRTSSIASSEIRDLICHSEGVNSLETTHPESFFEDKDVRSSLEMNQQEVSFQQEAQALNNFVINEISGIKANTSHVTVLSTKPKDATEEKEGRNKIPAEKLKEYGRKEDTEACEEPLLGSLFGSFKVSQKTSKESRQDISPDSTVQEVAHKGETQIEGSTTGEEITSVKPVTFESNTTKPIVHETDESICSQSTGSVQSIKEEQSNTIMDNTLESQQKEKIEKSVDVCKGVKVNQWVSSVDVSSGEVTAKTLPMAIHSPLQSQAISEVSSGETITMSVTASHGKTVVQTSGDVWKGKERNSCMQGSSDELPAGDSLSSGNTKPLSVRKKDSFKKLQHSMSEDSPVLNKTTPKQLKVEIVPFSQRMKDKKYQPLNVSGDSKPLESHKELGSKQVANYKAKFSAKPEFTSHKDEKNINTSVKSAIHSKDKGTVFSKFDVNTEEIADTAEHPIHSRVKGRRVSEPVSVGSLYTTATVEEESSVTSVNYDSVATTSNLWQNNTSETKDTTEESFNCHGLGHASDQGSLSSTSEADVNEQRGPRWEVKIQPVSRGKQESSSLHDTAPHTMETSSGSVSVVKDEALNKPAIENNFASLSSWGERGGMSVTVVNRKQATQDAEEKSQLADSTQSKSNEPRRLSLKGAPAVISDGEPELFRVFARRSIKQRNLEKEKTEDVQVNEDNMQSTSRQDDSFPDKGEQGETSSIISISNNSTIIKISEVTLTKNTSEKIVEKASESTEETKPQSLEETPETKPLCPRHVNKGHFHTAPEMLHKEKRETYHKRQRKASAPDLPVSVQNNGNFDGDLRQEQAPVGVTSTHSSSYSRRQDTLARASSMSSSLTSGVATSSMTVSNGNNSAISDSSKFKDSVDLKNNKDGTPPSWLQLAQQRREMREQRERLLLGSSAPSFVLESSTKPSRSSKVWDMVNNFQKMQMT